MKVSIAMTTCDGERVVAEQIESCFRQERRPDELVICDDASTDGTLRVVEELAAEAPFPMTVLRNHHRSGIRTALARALDTCAGDWIFVADQDDCWLSNKVSSYLLAIERRPNAFLVCSDSALVDGRLEDLGRTLWRHLRFSPGARRRVESAPFRGALRYAPLPGHGMALRRAVLDAVLPFPGSWFYDQWITHLCAAIGDVLLLDAPLTLYRQHSGQQLGPGRQSLRAKVLDPAPVPAGLAFDRQLAALDELEARLTERLPKALAQHAAELQLRRSYLVDRRRMREGSLFRRVARVAKNVVTARYWTIGRGGLAIARDLLAR